MFHTCIDQRPCCPAFPGMTKTAVSAIVLSASQTAQPSYVRRSTACQMCSWSRYSYECTRYVLQHVLLLLQTSETRHRRHSAWGGAAAVYRPFAHPYSPLGSGFPKGPSALPASRCGVSQPRPFGAHRNIFLIRYLWLLLHLPIVWLYWDPKVRKEPLAAPVSKAHHILHSQTWLATNPFSLVNPF